MLAFPLIKYDLDSNITLYLRSHRLEEQVLMAKGQQNVFEFIHILPYLENLLKNKF